MATKEKTKTELLNELNEKLEKENRELKQRNDELISEIRQTKSQIVRYEDAEAKIKNLASVEKQNSDLNKRIKNYVIQSNYQSEQIDALLKGINTINDEMKKTFENIIFSINLMRDNYEKTISKVQNDLNIVEKKYAKYFDKDAKEEQIEKQEEYKIEESE